MSFKQITHFYLKEGDKKYVLLRFFFVNEDDKHALFISRRCREQGKIFSQGG